MKLIHLNENSTEIIKEPIAAMIGAFDGFHIGHQALLEKTLKVAKEKGIASAIITFNPNPKYVIRQHNSKVLLTMMEKIEYMDVRGVDYFVIIDFNYHLRSLSARDFVQEYLLGNCVEQLVCGFDFNYGRGKERSGIEIEKDSDHKIDVHVIHSIDYGSQKVSSTRIYNCLKEGDVEQANELLGRPYCINGKVIDGNKIGRTIGFPTANIDMAANYQVPKCGVYGVQVMLGDELFYGICNIGVKPTIKSNNKMSIEVFLFDFDRDIYGHSISVLFHKFIRNEQKFETLTILKQQIQRDIDLYLSIK